MKKLLILAILTSTFFLGGAEVIFDGSTPEKWQDGKARMENGALFVTGDFSLTYSKDFIPVTPGKKYEISGEFRITGNFPGKLPLLYFGFVPYTADGREISHAAIGTAMPPALAILTEDVKKGDKVLKIKISNAADWKLLGHGMLAFNAKADCSDLPNMDLSPFFDLNNCKLENGVYTIALKSPMTKDYPAGTVVRQHRSGNMFVYAGWGNNSDWMKFSIPVNSFYAGTAKIKIALRLLTRKGQVEVRNVKFATR